MFSGSDDEEDAADEVPKDEGPDEDVVVVEVLEELHVSEEQVEDHKGVSASRVILEANAHELKHAHTPDVSHNRIEVECVHPGLVGLHGIKGHAKTSEPKLVVSLVG